MSASMLCTITILVLTFSVGLAAICDGPGNTNIILNEFTAFPSTVEVGDTVFIRAKITPAHEILAAQVQIRVYLSTSTDTPLIDIPGIDLCTLTSNVKCPITATSHIFMWEFVVPQISPGTYQIRYNIVQTVGANTTYSSCIQFSFTITNNIFIGAFSSWYSATLLGTAFFTRNNYTDRTVGDVLQVGPSGPLVNWDGSELAYGTISSITGSGDLVPSTSFDTTGYVWGITGTLQKKTFGLSSGQESHIYKGDFYLGYIRGGSNYNYTNPLLYGSFTLNWTYADASNAVVSGSVMFSRNATIPPGWGVPLLFGRLETHSVITSKNGFLVIQGGSDYCPNGICPHDSVDGSPSLSSDKLALVIALPIAFVFIVVLIAAALIFYRNRRKTEQEDGIFAVARKPEYGAALVVDDIIQETKGNKNFRSMLNHQYSEDEDDPSYDEEEDYESEDASRSRTLSRSPSRSLSRSPRRSPSFSRSRSNSRTLSHSSRGERRHSSRPRGTREDTDPGESASRASDREYSE